MREIFLQKSQKIRKRVKKWGEVKIRKVLSLFSFRQVGLATRLLCQKKELYSAITQRILEEVYVDSIILRICPSLEGNIITPIPKKSDLLLRYLLPHQLTQLI